MSSDKEDRIKTRAYHIWERQGRTDGQHDEHWAQAERELEDEDGKAGSSPRVTTADDPSRVSASGGGVSGFSGAQSSGAEPASASPGGTGGGSGVSSGLQRGGTAPASPPAGGTAGSAPQRKP